LNQFIVPTYGIINILVSIFSDSQNYTKYLYIVHSTRTKIIVQNTTIIVRLPALLESVSIHSSWTLYTSGSQMRPKSVKSEGNLLSSRQHLSGGLIYFFLFVTASGFYTLGEEFLVFFLIFATQISPLMYIIQM
jgi:hypothetical protein